MSEEKRMPVLTGQKKQIFYTGLVYLLVCFMTAGVTVFLTKEKKDEVKEVSAVVTEEPKVNTGYAAMETNPLLENRDEELADAVEAYYQELSGKEAYAEHTMGLRFTRKTAKQKAAGSCMYGTI